MRKHGEIGGEDLIPSIRALGILQPLLVRPNCEGFEVVAGQRRYHACTEIAKDTGLEPIPCLIMEDGDDTKAVEASLAENVERLPMDEIDQYEAFRTLSSQGRSVAEIADHFGVTERLVQQRLALAGLHPPILNAYRRKEINATDLRNLTMASLKQQKTWWKRYNSKEDYAPQGHGLRKWLFGGDEIPVSNALFDLPAYKGAIVSDLFGEERYFADSALFWEHQGKAIADIMEDHRAEGWQTVILHDVGEYWRKWDYVKVPKEDGGEVHITCASDGEVTIHEGYLEEKAYRKRLKAEEAGEDKGPSKPELTKAMQNYLALHRHSAVRTELLKDQGVALRLLVAQFIAGSHADPQKADTDAIAESLKTNKAEDPFEAERKEVRALLGMEESGNTTLVPRKDDWDHRPDPYQLFAKLLKLDDAAVMRILTFVAAETLPAGSAMVEVLGVLLKVDMKTVWQPDDTFFDLFKDKEAINAAVKVCAGKNAAKAHVTATAKVQKDVIRKSLTGERKEGNPDWQPRYMAFPMQGYTKRNGLVAIEQWAKVKSLFDAV
ncbi:ParB/RepB/Spo0J family partition protein [uncultured Roseibium sp.]|uniref:ParB/RepB/Spo0J family partition protein n=1 Tax=uncultured Roseibium sp. TaxID=1936171 RepID=UPI003217CFE4